MKRKIDLTIPLKARPQQAWQAWTDPRLLAQWFVDRASGEPRVGAEYTWAWEDFDPGVCHKVLEVDPERRIVLTFPTGEALLEITLHKEGGDTVIHLVNSGFRDGAEWDDEYTDFRNGWSFCLHTLKLYLEEHWQQEKQMLVAFQPARFDYGRLAEQYRRRDEWLDLGVPLPQTVIEDAGREVLYRWDEVQGVLELKSFESPPGRTLGIRALSWAPQPVFDGMKPRAQASVRRLAERLTK